MSTISGFSSIGNYLQDIDTSSMSASELAKLEQELNKQYEAAYQEKLSSLLNGSNDKITRGQTILSAAEGTIDSLTALSKVAGSRDTASISAAVSNFASSYQSTITAVTSDGSKGLLALKQGMFSLFSDNSEALEAVGISFSKDGSVSVDEEILENASAEDLTNLFGESSSFMSQLKEYFDTVATVASMNISSYRSQQTLYSSTGTLSSSSNMTKSMLDAFF